jgi:hypothetical protein
MDPVRLAAAVDASAEVPAGLSYGTAGFRAHEAKLGGIMLRMGMLAALRSAQQGKVSPGARTHGIWKGGRRECGVRARGGGDWVGARTCPGGTPLGSARSQCRGLSRVRRRASGAARAIGVPAAGRRSCVALLYSEWGASF